MEEMNQNNEEVVTEQRPSTKYGRTAYQQEEQNPYQQNPYQQYTPYEEPKREVKNVFAYILMLLVAITGIINFVTTIMATEAYHVGNSLEEVVEATLAIADRPGFYFLSTLGDFIFVATVVFFVLDILQLNKAGKKITGAILFAIFLRPAYFIWRAHLLGQKKAVPIIYAVCVYLLSAVGFFVTMMAASEMVLRTMY